MKKKELRRQIRELRTERDLWRQHRWAEIPESARRRWVEQALMARARRRAALSPFARSFEDEVNNAAVDVYRDFNRATF